MLRRRGSPEILEFATRETSWQEVATKFRLWYGKGSYFLEMGTEGKNNANSLLGRQNDLECLAWLDIVSPLASLAYRTSQRFVESSLRVVAVSVLRVLLRTVPACVTEAK